MTAARFVAENALSIALAGYYLAVLAAGALMYRGACWVDRRFILKGEK